MYDVRGEVSLQRTSERGRLKGCQVGLVWLGPRAAAWAAHRVSQVCLSALWIRAHLNVREATQRKSRVFIVHYITSPSG